MAGPSTKWIGKRSPRGAAWARRGAALAAAAIAVATSLAACSGGDEGLDPPSPGGGGSGASGGGTTTGGPCTEGAQRECHVTLGEHDGVLTCLDGVETCEGGSWTGCNGSMRTMRAPGRLAGPEGGGQYPRPMSLSTATDCIDNPCDPSCQVFNEDPGPGGVTIPAALPPYPWNVGNINDVPPSVIDQGTQEPCSTAEDCQFDQYCDNPSGVACSHHPCAPGAGLFASCSPCVQKICDEDPTCCLVDYAGTCLHDPCAQGSALKASCDPCVASICAARPGCCEPLCTTTAECQALVGPTSTCNAQGRCSCGAAIGVCPTGASCTSGRCVPFWGSGSCASQVPTLCAPKTCPAANVWSAACAAKVATTCGAVCDPPDPAGCPHDKCYTGSALPMLTCGADPCVNLICTGAGGDSTCCTSAWTQSCVDKVLSMCAISCPTKGQCTSWLPDETDPGCAGVDLTLGIPCGGTVPVCNRGNATIPAGTIIDVVQYPAGASQIASSEPDEVLNSCNPAAGTPACSFTLPQALDGGDCVDVTGCVGLTDGMELMVNPSTSANHINECHCENNWSIYQSGPCGSPGCIASASVSFIKPVTMMISVDNSTSMACSSAGCPAPCSDRLATRWTPMTTALKSFFQDPSSAGLGVALKFWPDPATGCHDSPACPGPGGGGCATPLVPLGTLTTDAAPADAHEDALINAVNARTPCRETPMYPALDGATSWAISRKIANPDEEVVVVFITDGIANACNSDNLAIAALAQNAFYNYNIRTYVIGFGNSNPTFIDQMASAGGGTSFNLVEGAALSTTLLNAMKSIRGDLLSCDIAIPSAGIGDPANVDVIYTSSAGVDTDLGPVLADPADCIAAGGGWYVDPVDPSKAKLCPSTCATVQADVGAKVQAVLSGPLSCVGTLSQLTYTQTYHANCPAGTKVQWGYLQYDSTTPADSSVVFDVRSAEAEADLPAATTSNAATAHAAPTDTQVCTTAQVPPCSVDLYNALGGLPGARNDYLELILTLNPTSDGQQAPTVHDWEITYSCPASE